jgi:hypothetical protein
MAAPSEYLFSTALKWKPNGELATRDLCAARAVVMHADQRPFEIKPTKPMTYVALIADASGRYASVYGNANSWDSFVDQLEDVGCEVVENQTSDYDNINEIEEDCVTIEELTGKESNFIPFP